MALYLCRLRVSELCECLGLGLGLGLGPDCTRLVTREGLCRIRPGPPNFRSMARAYCIAGPWVTVLLLVSIPDLQDKNAIQAVF